MKYRVISADNHVMEPPGTFVDRVPALRYNLLAGNAVRVFGLS